MMSNSFKNAAYMEPINENLVNKFGGELQIGQKIRLSAEYCNWYSNSEPSNLTFNHRIGEVFQVFGINTDRNSVLMKDAASERSILPAVPLAMVYRMMKLNG